MSLQIGIVGLPNVGKSTLFNALLKKQIADVANYPFCTIEPNVGVIEVPDERLPVLAKVVHTEKIVPAVVQFYDIAGLVKGAAQGAGLGNKFLAHIREVAAILHVVRLFVDETTIHVSNKIDPQQDIETIETELILADLATIEKQPEPRQGRATREELAVWEVVKKVKGGLDQGLPVRKLGLTREELEETKHLNLLTIKPVLYAFNVSEEQLNNSKDTENKIEKILSDVDASAPYIIFSAKLETDVLTLSPEEQKEYLKQYHLEDLGLNRLVKKSYEMLDLISFLTAGEKEVRAWTIKNDTPAQQAAGVIHTDFAKHFICADVIPYADFVALDGWAKAREDGKIATVGKDYVIKDGEVLEIKSN